MYFQFKTSKQSLRAHIKYKIVAFDSDRKRDRYNLEMDDEYEE